MTQTITSEIGLIVTVDQKYKKVYHGYNLGMQTEHFVKVTGKSGDKKVWQKEWSTLVSSRIKEPLIAEFLIEQGLSENEVEKLGFYVDRPRGLAIGI
ncbi:MAG TPA: hypothetical protein VGU44_02055 [Gammaproteobacteria bacterium]|nr:hypothetical protein [Gammaproteobacteria bacterium]